MRDFRFSFTIARVRSRTELRQKCRRAEEFGYDTVFAPDHVGILAPFPLLVAAAEATERLRVGTLVLNAPFWNPALLAREVATTDLLTDGRLELGLGAGHMKWEFDMAAIPWRPFGARVETLATTIDELKRLFRAEELPEEFSGAPQPVQRTGFDGSGPPLIVGGTGDRVLRVAAEHADIVGVAGAYQKHGEPPGRFRLGTAAEAAERVRFARDHAGARAERIEWNLLVQRVVETRDRRAAAEELTELFGPELTAEDILETPFLLVGTPAEMAEQLLQSREKYGYSYITVHEPFMETFGPVIELLK